VEYSVPMSPAGVLRKVDFGATGIHPTRQVDDPFPFSFRQDSLIFYEDGRETIELESTP
jgi:hypothetical protein